MGIARLLLAGAAILAVLALLVAGAASLIGSLSSGAPARPTGGQVTSERVSPPPSSPRASAGEEVPTLFIECRADRCPIFVRVSGGDIVEDRELSRGQRATYSQPDLDVVLTDASTVHVEVNGKARSPAKPGERQSFTVHREP